MTDPHERTDPTQADALINRERIRGATRMIPEGTDASKVTEEQIQQTAADVETFAAHHKITRAALSRATGYSAAVISEFLAGKYAGNKGQVAIDLENWLVEEEQRRQRPQTTQFVWTNVAMKIKSTASYCLDFKKIGLVYGPDTSGIGKTTALRAIAQELGPRKCSLVTVNKVDASANELLTEICRALGIADARSAKAKMDRIVLKLSGRSHLLILDQIHNLRFARHDRPLYCLTDLYDATGCAQLWCGTADMVAYLERQQSKNADESLAQLCRRIFPRVDLMDGLRVGGKDGGGNAGEPLVSVQQVREMFARNRLKLTDSAARFLCLLSNQPDSGSLGLCVQIVEYATMLGEQRGHKTLDLPLLDEALRCGLSRRKTDLLMARLDVEASAPRMAKVG